MNDIVFNARVIEKGIDGFGNVVILDNTEFYPDGKGGQLGDRGLIGISKILKITEDEKGRILHYVDVLPESGIVTCKIDVLRRKDISIQHTAQHILSQSFVKLFNIETVGFHMGEDYTTVDFSIDKIQEDFIFKAEDFANEIVLENRLVKKYFVSENDLPKLDLRKKGHIKGNIRIVEIEGFDISMCGGTHVDFTGEIGIIKIVKQEKIRKTYARLYFVAGLRALRDYRKKACMLSNISQLLTSGEGDVFNKIQCILDENKALIKGNKTLKEELFEYIANDFVKNAEQIGEVEFIARFVNYSKEDVSLLGRLLSKREKLISLILGREINIFGSLICGPHVSLNAETIKTTLSDVIMRSWENKGTIFFEFKEGISVDNIINLVKNSLKG
jgi:alanyl-tRNA synthetase